jgi:selenocysteine-specific elongation factor
MPQTNYIIATAGHVDHGKSALVNALSGTDPDRLPEEKKRGMTIDLGFAHIELGDAQLAIIDVPGHEDFVKNMIAGVGSIDLALLIVASDDGWMPQTEEHVQILQYLGVKHMVVVLTKADLAGELAELALEEVCEQLIGTPYEGCPSISTSAETGEGIEELKSLLAETLSTIPPQTDVGKPRLYVDRAFSKQGLGTVVTGTLTGGFLHKDQDVIIHPQEAASRIRGIQNHAHESDKTPPGTRTALNLRDIDVAGKQRTGIKRGHVVTVPGLGDPHAIVDVHIFRTQREALMSKGALQPIKHGARVRIHHGSSSLPARIFLMHGSRVKPGGTAIAQLRFEQPVFSFAGDHFILRDWPEEFTLAGGVILDPDARTRDYRFSERIHFLLSRAAPDADLHTWLAAEISFKHAIPTDRVLAKSTFSREAIASALADPAFTVEDRLVVDGAYWSGLKERIGTAVDDMHIKHPELAGVKIAELAQLGVPEPLLTPLLASMTNEGYARSGPHFKRADHTVTLPPDLEAEAVAMRAKLEASPLEPPSRKDLVVSGPTKKAMQFLLDTGEVTALNAEIVMLTSAYQQAVDTVRGHIETAGPATASDLRKAIGTTRRILMPLLEFLDQSGITQRNGDVRVLREF